MACHEVLAQDLHLSLQTCVASDCLEVINNLQRPYMELYGMITREISEMASLFEKVMFRHEDMGSNAEAHHLASVNLAIGRQVWIIGPPKGFNFCKSKIFR